VRSSARFWFTGGHVGWCENIHATDAFIDLRLYFITEMTYFCLPRLTQKFTNLQCQFGFAFPVNILSLSMYLLNKISGARIQPPNAGSKACVLPLDTFLIYRFLLVFHMTSSTLVSSLYSYHYSRMNCVSV
jgi:hypothetical protein